MSTDMAMDIILQEGEQIRQIVQGADFKGCPPNMQRVYLFLVNAAMANLRARQGRLFSFVSGSGFGAGLLAIGEVYGRWKGWW